MRIDAHQHYWLLERGDYTWITPEMKTLYRDYLPIHLRAHLDKHRIDGTILVQAAETVQESLFMLELAEKESTILGVVGWIDIFDEQYLEQLKLLMCYKKCVGIRIMMQNMQDCHVLLENKYSARMAEIIKLGIPIDLLVTHKQLDTVIKLLHLFPNMNAVIDHIGKPNIATQHYSKWASDMEQIASYNNVYCKLSGMVTEADHLHWKMDDCVPYIQHVLHCFGKQRVMFGSDWPVCLLAASYDEVINNVHYALPLNWDDESEAALFGKNALTFYKINQN